MEQKVVDLLKPEHLIGACGAWGGKPEALKAIRQVENFVYSFYFGGQEGILRLTHSSHRSSSMVAAELHWMEFLASHGIPLALPIPNTKGQLTEILPSGDSYFIATVFEVARGVAAEDKDSLFEDLALVKTVGQTMGKIHRLTQSYVPLTDKRPEWSDDDIIVDASQHLPPKLHYLLEGLDKEVHWLKQLPKTQRDYGLIHADMDQSNYFVDQGQITLFDFDESAYHWFIYDIAIVLYEASYNLDGLPEQRKKEDLAKIFDQLMEGYQMENELEGWWWRHLPRFLRFYDLLYVIFACKKNLNNEDYYLFKFALNNLKEENTVRNSIFY